jgi:NADPH:quinone reductase-like Zn-dependent oxidoreductase
LETKGNEEMSDLKMHAVRVKDYGGPEVLVYEEAPRPLPKAGEVLIRVNAAGVNPVDSTMRSGAYKQFMPLQFPWTPGVEGAGIIEAIGAEVFTFQPAQEIYGILSGAYAEYAIALVKDIQPKPTNLTFEQAAAVPMGALTAWGTVMEAANVQAGQRVLVHGAAGGVGAFAVQLARWKGAHVIGVASAGNLEFVRSLGAELAIDYNAAPFENVVNDMDVVVDTVGGDIPDRSWQVLHKDGVFVTVAARLAPEAGKVQGVQAMSARRAPTENLKQISDLLASKKIIPVIGTSFPLKEARQAQELSQMGHGRGRIILRIP